MGVYGITGVPCSDINEPECTSGVFQVCSGVQGACIGQVGLPYFPVNPPTLQGYEITWVNTTDQDITDVLLYGHFLAGGIPENSSYQYFLDDLVITSSCSPQISVTPTVLQQCIDGQAVIEYLVCLENPEPEQKVEIDFQAIVPSISGLSVVSGGGFNSNGAASVFLPDEDGDPNCVTLTLTLNVGENFQPGTELTIGMEGTSAEVCILGGGIVEALLVLEICEGEPCECSPGALSFNIGNSPQSVNYASQTALAALAPDVLTYACIAVSGRLVWDIEGMVESSHIIMNEGAELVVTSGADLYLLENLIEGCDHMWRSLTVQAGGNLRLESNRIYDAQYAVRAEKSAAIQVTDNEFDRDYVGLYVPPSVNGQIQTVQDEALTGNAFTCTTALKTPYAGQTPTPGPATHTAFLLHDVAGFDIGIDNLADGVGNGVIAFRSAFSMKQCTVQNLLPASAGLNFEYYGVRADNCAKAEILDCQFEEVAQGIYADNTNLTARDNKIATFDAMIGNQFNAGIVYFNGTGRQVRIQGNNVLASRVGISVSNCQPAAGLRVRNNIVDLHPGSPIWRNGIFLGSCNTGWIRYNTVQNNTGNNNYNGMYLLDCHSLNVVSNNILGQYNGVNIYGCSANNFLSNDVLADGYSGGLAATGFNAYNSADRYCSNETGDHGNAGFSFEGACSPSRLTCNQIGDAFFGIQLWADFSDPNIGTVISPQLNRGNQWTGTYGAWGAFNATTDPMIIQDSRFTMPSGQIPSWSTGVGQSAPWFSALSGDGINCITACFLPIDPVDDYPNDPDDEDDGLVGDGDIRAAKGEINGEGIRWMTQQRLYERLSSYGGLLEQDTFVATFYDTSANTALGRLYELKTQLNLLKGRSEYDRYFLEDVQTSVLTAFDSLQALRTAGPNGNEAAWRNGIRARQHQLAWLMGLFYGYEEEAVQQRRNESEPLAALNDSIVITSGACPANEKSLNQIVLENGLWYLSPQSSTVVNAVKSIADQCPNEAGLSVYSARAIYLYFDPEAYWEDECSDTEEKPAAVHEGQRPSFVVMPNPANESLTLLAGEGQQGVQFELVSLTGQVVRSAVLGAGTQALSIDTRALPTGVYFYRLRTEQGVWLQSGKVVITH